jgi:hypothetical protein
LDYVPPKRPLSFNGLHGVISQKIVPLITTAVRTSTVCVAGMRFGLMQTKVGLVSLLSSYEVQASQETQVPVALDPKSIVTTPVGGMYLKITERSDKR